MDGSNWYVYCSNNPLCFVDPTGLLTVKQYIERREQSEAAWEPNQDWFNEDTGIFGDQTTVWFYGFFGGSNYTAGEDDNTIENNMELFNLKPLNSVDATFRKHDWNGIDPNSGLFVDPASEQAIISNIALGRDLANIINTRQVFDEDGVALQGDELDRALRAAGEAHMIFNDNGGPGADDFMTANNMNAEQFEQWRNSPEIQSKIEAARNVKMSETTREWMPLEN